MGVFGSFEDRFAGFRGYLRIHPVFFSSYLVESPPGMLLDRQTLLLYTPGSTKLGRLGVKGVFEMG